MSNRTNTIADFIRSAIAPAMDSKAVLAEAAEAVKDASASNINAREVLQATIARAAHAEAWTNAEIAGACTAIAKSYNDKKGLQAKTFATLAGEIKRAADEKVRGVFPMLQHLRDQAWSAEEAARQADKNAPTPCRDAFARSYHMLQKMMSACIDAPYGSAVFSTMEDVNRFVAANDPRMKPERIAKAVEKLKADVEYLNARMPMQMLRDILAFVNAHTPEQIEAQVAAEIEAQRNAALEKAAAEDELLGGDDATGEGDAPNEPARLVPVVTTDPVDDLLGFAAAA